MQKNSLSDHVNTQFDKIRFETGTTVVKDLSREEKQYQLLMCLNEFILAQVKAMPDFELADKCRETTLMEMFGVIGEKLGFVASIPPELAGKSLAQVLYILDYAPEGTDERAH